MFSAATVAPAKLAKGGVAASRRQAATDRLSTDFCQPYPQIPVHKLISNTRALVFLWITYDQLNIMDTV